MRFLSLRCFFTFSRGTYDETPTRYCVNIMCGGICAFVHLCILYNNSGQVITCKHAILFDFFHIFHLFELFFIVPFIHSYIHTQKASFLLTFIYGGDELIHVY